MPLTENGPHSETQFRDTVSSRGATGKAHPGLEAKSGMQFPLEGRSGNGIPLWGREMECSFPGRPLWETVSHFGAEFWDALSQTSLKGKARPGLRLDSGTWFPPSGLSAGPTLISHVLEHVLSSFNTAGKLPFFGKVHVPKLTWFS